MTFSEGELGTQLPADQLPPHLHSHSENSEPQLKLKDELVEKTASSLEPKGTPSPSKAASPSQSSGKTPRRIRPTQLASFPSPTSASNTKTQPPVANGTPPPSPPSAPPTNNAVQKTVSSSNGGGNAAGPRRVNFVTLEKFSGDKEDTQHSAKLRDKATGSEKTAGEPMEIQSTE